MKKITTFFLFLSIVSVGFSQKRYIESFQDLIRYSRLNQGEPSNKHLERHLRIWEPRIGRSDSSGLRALGAIQSYCKDFEAKNSSKELNRYTGNTPIWEPLGPTGTSSQAHFDGGRGIGRMNRITFDPDYEANQTLYATSNQGGVWRSTDGGNNWAVFGTDTQLPFTIVSDIAVCPDPRNLNGPNLLFICTGNNDGVPPFKEGQYGVYAPFEAGRYGIYTQGIFMGTVSGNNVTWEPINNWAPQANPPSPSTHFMRFFEAGNYANLYPVGDGSQLAWGTTQRILARVNPTNLSEIELTIASSNGIIRTEIDMWYPLPEAEWERVFVGNHPNFPTQEDNEFRGLAYRPFGNGSIVYASGRDIYKSTNYGTSGSWASITGAFTGLDLNNLLNCPICEVARINIEVCPVDPDLLFAYLHVYEYDPNSKPVEKHTYIYKYDETPTGSQNWELLHHRTESSTTMDCRGNCSSSLLGTMDDGRLGLAVDPTDPSKIYYGGNVVFGTNNVNNTPFQLLTSYCGPEVHADIYDLKFPPISNLQNPPAGYFKLFCAHDGGISLKENDLMGCNATAGWKSISNGLQTARIWGFDDSEFSKDVYAVALQDCDVMRTIANTGGTWTNISNGNDGYGVQISDRLLDGKEQFFYKRNTNSTFSVFLQDLQPPNFTETSPLNNFVLNSPSPKAKFPVDPRAYSGSNLGGPAMFIINGFKLINHPLTGEEYFGLSEIANIVNHTSVPNYLNYTFDWNIVSDIGKIEKAVYRRQPSAFAISQSDPGYMYYAISEGYNHDQSTSVDPQPRVLFRTIMGNGGCQNCPSNVYGTEYPSTHTGYPNWNNNTFFEDITDNLYNDVLAAGVNLSYPVGSPNPEFPPHLPTISGIEVHPDAPEKIWVTFSGYTNGLKVWYSIDGGDTWSNWDPSGTLVNLPVNDIEYQNGSNDRLFIATDAGVYVKEGSQTSAWSKFGLELPNTRIMELKINYCAAKLRCSTFGRGIWDADLPDIFELGGTLEVSTTQPWRGQSPGPIYTIAAGERVSLKTNLTIKSGVTFIVAGELGMPAKGRITVEPGAKLLVDGGTITNFCGEMWHGIFLLGNAGDPQAPLPPDPMANQGFVELNNAIIENAVNAITAWDEDLSFQNTGGVVQATNSIFRNNRRAIYLLRYTDGLNDNLSFFKDCTFTVDNGFEQLTDDGFIAHAVLWEVQGISFESCRFENMIFNSSLDILDRGVGIISYDANFTVSASVPDDPSIFLGLYQGINASSIDQNHFFEVSDSEFTENLHGINAERVDNYLVLSSAFNFNGIAQDHDQIGIVMANCTGFTIEENNFAGPMTPPANQSMVGIEAYDTGTDPNQIAKNNFEYLTMGNFASGINRDAVGLIGLVYLCNTNAENEFDFVIERVNSGDGIAVNQQTGPSGAAHNTFSFTGPTPTPTDISNDGEPIRYFHPAGETAKIPKFFTMPGKVDVISTSSNYPPDICGDEPPERQQTSGDQAFLQKYSYHQRKKESLNLLNTQSEVAYHATQMGKIANQAIQFHLGNENWEHAIGWLERKGSLQSWYFMVDLWFKLGDSRKGLLVLNKIPSRFTLAEYQRAEFESFRKLKRLLASQDKSGNSLLDFSQEQLNLISDISEEKYSLAGTEARSLLNLIRVSIDETQLRSLPRKVTLPKGKLFPDLQTGMNLWLYPNPTNGEVNITMKIPPSSPKAYLAIRDLQGRILKTQTVEDSKSFVWNIREWNSGIYLCTFYVDGKDPETQKLILIK